MVKIASHWIYMWDEILASTWCTSIPEHSLALGRPTHTHQHTTKSEERKKKERWVCPDLVAPGRSDSSLWSEAQTWLDLHQTWWARSSLRVLRSGQLVWVLVQWSIRFERSFVSSSCCSSEQSSFGRGIVWVVKRGRIELKFGQYTEDSWNYLPTKIGT